MDSIRGFFTLKKGENTTKGGHVFLLLCTSVSCSVNLSTYFYENRHRCSWVAMIFKQIIELFTKTIILNSTASFKESCNDTFQMSFYIDIFTEHKLGLYS